MSSYLSNFNFDEQEKEIKNSYPQELTIINDETSYQNLVIPEIDNQQDEEIELIQSLLFDILNQENDINILIKVLEEIGSNFRSSHFEYNISFIHQDVHNRIDELLESEDDDLKKILIKMLQYFSFTIPPNQNIPFELIDQCFHIAHILEILESKQFSYNDLIIQYLLTIYSKDEQTIRASSELANKLFPIARETNDEDTKIAFIEFFYSFCIKCKVNPEVTDGVEFFNCLSVFLEWNLLKMRVFQIAYYLFNHFPDMVSNFINSTEIFYIIIHSFNVSNINTLLHSLYLTDLLIENKILSITQVVDTFRNLIKPWRSHTQSICEKAFQIAEHALYGGIIVEEIIETGITESIIDVISIENQYAGSSKIAAGKAAAAILYCIKTEQSESLPMEDFLEIVEETHDGGFLPEDIYDSISTKFASD